MVSNPHSPVLGSHAHQQQHGTTASFMPASSNLALGMLNALWQDMNRLATGSREIFQEILDDTAFQMSHAWEHWQGSRR